MNKLLFIAALLLVSYGCANNKNNRTGGNDEDTGSTMEVHSGIDNVNGNIPDTVGTGAKPITHTDEDSVGTP